MRSTEDGQLRCIKQTTALVIGLSFGILGISPAFAGGDTATVQAGEILATLLLCGLMGAVGQGCRVIVGFATIATSKAVAPAENQDVFNLARLLFSLVVGFLAGVVTALVRWKQSDGLSGIEVGKFNEMLSFAIAGYIGTDVVEAFTVQFFEKKKSEAQAPGHEPPE